MSSNPEEPKPIDGWLQDLSKKPALYCRFYYDVKVIDAFLQLPLLGKGTPIGTSLDTLEIWLQQAFVLPSGYTVLAVVPAEEMYCPPLPLAMINNLAEKLFFQVEQDEKKTPLVLHLSLVVKPIAPISQVIEALPTVSVEALQSKNTLDRQMEAMKLVHCMTQNGFVRLTTTSQELVAIYKKAYESTKKWIEEQRILKPCDRWYELVDATEKCGGCNEESEPIPSNKKGRFVGFAQDKMREWVQMRQPLNKNGTIWPPKQLPFDYSEDLIKVLNMLNTLAITCLSGITEILNDDPQLYLDLLDHPNDVSSSDVSSSDVSTSDASSTVNEENYHYGAAVLRIYNYRRKAPDGDPNMISQQQQQQQPILSCTSNANQNSCGVHADLGLLTVSPPATIPGLMMWNLDTMKWLDVESDASPNEFCVFAGETLGLLTKGMIKAPLHRVPQLPPGIERRMSMPYFLRARPDAEFHPKITTTSSTGTFSLTCKEFMEERLFIHRPWRRTPSNGVNPDY